jgi:hypothetical protein
MPSGRIVAINCIISIGVDDESKLTVPPLLFVRVIELTFMPNAITQSAEESPILTCTAVVGVDEGRGVGVELLLPPPHPVSPIVSVARAVTRIAIDRRVFLTNISPPLNTQ